MYDLEIAQIGHLSSEYARKEREDARRRVEVPPCEDELSHVAGQMLTQVESRGEPE